MGCTTCRNVRTHSILEFEKGRHLKATVLLDVATNDQLLNQALKARAWRSYYLSSASLAGPVETGLMYFTLHFDLFDLAAKCAPSNVENTVLPTPVFAPNT
jgi:hypothetical protein